LCPHVSGLFAGLQFAELLERINAVIIEIRFVKFVAIVSAEFKITV
jgi:hypothetical protein